MPIKNLGPAILSSQQYRLLAYQHLQDPKAYFKLPPSTNKLRLLKSIQYDVEVFQKELCREHPDWRRNSRIISTNITRTRFARFRIMPKLHKRDKQNNWTRAVRPIIASPQSPTHGLSKWVDFLLRPYMTRYSTILKNSDDLLSSLQQMKLSTEDKVFTFDAKSLYTSIPLSEALAVIANITSNDPLAKYINKGLKIILSANYFTFDGQLFRQTQGIAMGTPVAPTVANLYLAYFEHKHIVCSSLWRNEIRLFFRYIDDLFVIWRPSTRKFKLNEFLARLRRQPGITWQPDAFHKNTADFLDLTIKVEKGKLHTKTFQKRLNLYLYMPYKSAHSPFILRGLIFGLLKKYRRQHTNYDEFISLANNLMKRLLARGYHTPILKSTLDLLAKPKYRHKKDHLNRSLFFSLEYNPNGPTNQLIRQILQLDSLEKMLTPLGFGNNIIIGLRRARNLREILCSTSRIAPTPSHAVHHKQLTSVRGKKL